MPTSDDYNRFKLMWERLASEGKCALVGDDYMRVRSLWVASACPSNIDVFIMQHANLDATLGIGVDDKARTPLLDTMERLNTLKEQVEARKASRARVMLISSFISMALLYAYYAMMLLVTAKVLHHAWNLLRTGAL